MPNPQLMETTPTPIVSPCVRLCCLDNNDICMGCFRSISEITGWASANEQTRRTYLAKSEQRRKLFKKD
ncbi:DUF1289 domain-containing protein [Methylosoma difficile]